MHSPSQGNTTKTEAVAVAGYSIETPRLLLNSTSRRFPHGVGNTADQVGRYVMVQGAPQVAGRFPDAISLAAGRPYEGFHEVADVSRYLARYAEYLADQGAPPAQVRRVFLQYGRTNGHIHGLIAQLLATDENVHVPPAAIAVTAGAQEAMVIALRGLCAEPGDVLLAADPCYVGIMGAAGLLDVPVVPVPETGAGIAPASVARVAAEVRAQGRRPRALYLVPNFANPSGVSLSTAARRELLTVAADQEVREERGPHRRGCAKDRDDAARDELLRPEDDRPARPGVEHADDGGGRELAASWKPLAEGEREDREQNGDGDAALEREDERWDVHDPDLDRVVRIQPARGEPGENSVLPAQSADDARVVVARLRRGRPGHLEHPGRRVLRGTRHPGRRRRRATRSLRPGPRRAVDADEHVLSRSWRRAAAPFVGELPATG